jgi:predicted transcriptional regulator of viral defense system
MDKNLKRELGRSLEERGWKFKRVSQGVYNVK